MSVETHITIINDPLGVNKIDHRDINHERLLDFLIEEYGPDGFDTPTVIYADGLKDGNEIDLGMHGEDGYPLHCVSHITLIHFPADPVTIITVASFLLTVYSTFFMQPAIPMPQVPEFEQPKESPNNSLTNQTNIARPLQRIPDLYGTNRVYPDLIAKSYFEFIDNIKFQTEFLCFGRGEFQVVDLKSGDTLISDIVGASATIFGPSTGPTELLDVTESNEVNGQEITGPVTPVFNEFNTVVTFPTTTTINGGTSAEFDGLESLTAGDPFTIEASDKFPPFTDVVTFPTPTTINGAASTDFAELNSLTSGDQFTMVTVSGLNDGTYTFVSFANLGTPTVPNYEIVIVETLPSAVSDSADFDYIGLNDGTYTFVSFSNLGTVDVPDYEVVITETLPSAVSDDYVFSTSVLKPGVGPFTVPGDAPEQIWIDFQWQQGIRTNKSNKIRLDYDVILTPIDSGGTPIGPPEVNSIVVNENERTAQFKTFKFTPASPGDRYQCEVSFTDASAESDFDTAKWTRLAGVIDRSGIDFGNVTTVLVNTEATEQATKLQRREFNAIATRELITYDTGTQTLTTVKTPTARFADACLDILTDPKMGNTPISNIDLDELYAIQESLETDPIYGDTLVRFCYSFSNARTSVADEIKTCVNAARVTAYKRGPIFQFVRDQIQPNRSGLFNRRNKSPDGEVKRVRFQLPSDVDGVELEWIDEITGDGNTVILPPGGSVNPTRIQAAGIKNYSQAWNRATYEFARIKLQRTSVDAKTTAEGILLPLNARVGNVDGTSVFTQDGGVTGVSGLEITTTEQIDFEGNPTGTVFLRKDDGTPDGPFVVLPLPGNTKGFILNSSPGFTPHVRGDSDYQVETLYSFAADANHDAEDYLVTDMDPQGDGYVKIALINYDEAIYDADSTTPTLQVT